MWPFVFVKLYWTTSPLVVIWWSLIVCFCVILTVTHSCIIATVQLHHPDGREAINRYIDWKCLRIYSLLSTRADRQGVDISVTVCVFVFCTVTVFSAENKASGVKFCMAVHRRPRLGISHFCELCSPRSSKSDKSASAWRTMNVPVGDSTAWRGYIRFGSVWCF